MRVGGQLRQVLADNSQEMIRLQLANRSDAIESRSIKQSATQCIGRIRGIHNNAAVTYDLGSLPSQSFLRMSGMNLEVLAHVRT